MKKCFSTLGIFFFMFDIANSFEITLKKNNCQTILVFLKFSRVNWQFFKYQVATIVATVATIVVAPPQTWWRPDC